MKLAVIVAALASVMLIQGCAPLTRWQPFGGSQYRSAPASRAGQPATTRSRPATSPRSTWVEPE